MARNKKTKSKRLTSGACVPAERDIQSTHKHVANGESLTREFLPDSGRYVRSDWIEDSSMHTMPFRCAELAGPKIQFADYICERQLFGRIDGKCPRPALTKSSGCRLGDD